MKTLNDSALFKMNPDYQKIVKTIADISLLNDVLPLSSLDSEFAIINRRFNYGTEKRIMEEVNKGNIVFINKKELRLPKYLNVIGKMKADKSGPCMIINLDGYMNSKGEIFPRTLFALMQNGLINLELYRNWNAYTNNVKFLSINTLLYSRFTTKIFDKLFSIDLNKQSSDLVSYLFSKFFLINMCGKDNNELVNNIAYKSCFNMTSQVVIENLEKELYENINDEDFYAEIFTFFKALKYIPTLEKSNIRSFIENYVRMYGEGSLLSVDYLPAFLALIYSQVVGGNINKDFMIEQVGKEKLNKSYVQFLNIMG